MLDSSGDTSNGSGKGERYARESCRPTASEGDPISLSSSPSLVHSLVFFYINIFVVSGN